VADPGWLREKGERGALMKPIKRKPGEYGMKYADRFPAANLSTDDYCYVGSLPDTVDGESGVRLFRERESRECDGCDEETHFAVEILGRNYWLCSDECLSRAASIKVRDGVEAHPFEWKRERFTRRMQSWRRPGDNEEEEG